MGNVVSNPKVSLSIVSADVEVANAAQKVLLVGIMTNGAAATSGALIENFPNDGSEATQFGIGNQLYEAIRVFKSIAPSVQLDVIPLSPNGAGTKAAYTLTISGNAEEAGTLTLILGSKKRHTYQVPVANGATNIQLAATIASTIGALVGVPFALANVSNVVTATYNSFGTFGNNIPIGFRLDGAVSGTVAGLSIVLAQSVQGATNPTTLASSAIFDVVGNNRYQGVVWPDSAQVSVPMDWLDTRFNANNKVLDGVCFVGKTDTYANCLSYAGTYNSKSGVAFLDKKLSIASSYFGPAGQENSYIVATAFAAVRAVRLTEDAAISQYLTTKASGDQFGGAALASLPYFNTTIPVLSIPIAGQGFTDTEIELLEAQGGSVIGQNSQGTNVLVGTVSTVYKTDPAGNADPSWKYLNYVDTMSAVREYFFNNYKKRFAQSRLTEGSVIRGRDMVNKAMFEAYTDRLFGDLTGPDFVLCQAGDVALKFFKKNRDVTLDLETGTVTVNMLVPIVTQVRTIIGTIKIAFSTEG